MDAKLGAFYSEIRQNLADFGVDSPDIEARRILKHRLDIDWGDIIADPDRKLPFSSLETIKNDLQKRMEGMPLSRLYGSREFYGLEFLLGSGTLDPRPETEILVDRALDLFRLAPPRRFLDLGTGTGCIPITLLSKWPGSYAIAVDLSESALNTARINARKHGVSERLGLVCGEWAGALATGFDLILSNPPYIPSAEIKNLEEGVRNHDPILALDGGDDGLEAYKNIFSSLKWLLNRGGKALFEIGAGQSDDVVRLAGNHGLCVEAVRSDYAGIQRVVEISSGDK